MAKNLHGTAFYLHANPGSVMFLSCKQYCNLTTLKEPIFIDRWGHSWFRTGVVLDQFVHAVVFIIIFACQNWINVEEVRPREGQGNSACALLFLYARTYASLPKSHAYRVNDIFIIIFCVRHVRFLAVFLSMRITDEHGTHRFYDVSRYPPSQPRPHCAFPWLLDEIEMDTSDSHCCLTFFGPK